jgi:hypothetical protein
MTIRRRLACGLTITAALLCPFAGTAASAAATTYTPLPAHVYAPYYETYLAPNTASITATAQQSGAKYFTLAFLQSPKKGSCALDWNGNSSQPLDYYASDIAALRHPRQQHVLGHHAGNLGLQPPAGALHRLTSGYQIRARVGDTRNRCG